MMRLLHVISSMNPLAGGPTEAIRQLAGQARAFGQTVEVATLDDPRAPFLRQLDFPNHALGPGWGTYGYSPRLVPWLRSHAPEFDAVIVNGLWQFQSLGTWYALRTLNVPYYVFTHGMLDPWFKRAYPLKHAKKWLYWPWGDYRVLRDAQAVLFTCEEERLLARRSFWLYRARELVVNFGVAPPPADAPRLKERFLESHPALRGRRLLLFMSRVHEKKGCDLLIEAFARVARAHPDVGLVMAGPDAHGLTAELKALARAHQVSERVSWLGMLEGDDKWGAFYASEALALPSHQENFGVVVAEALACGIPVLISDKVNIWREIEADGVGFVATDTVDGTESSLRRWLTLDAKARHEMTARTARTFAARYSAQAMARSVSDAVRRFAPTSP